MRWFQSSTTIRKNEVGEDGVLEAVIGMPAGLFYGTGIPACVPVSELEAEEYNLNIRRYVDNSPPPEPHDVRAHLNGGIPKSEVELLSPYFLNYEGLQEQLFCERDDNYHNFSPAVESKDSIKSIIESADCTQAKHAKFHKAIKAWWKKHVSEIENLPTTGNVFELRREFLDSISKKLTPQNILDVYKVRGAFADFMNRLDADFKSVAASGWGAELIPEADILQSQFPEVLQQIEDDQARIAELEGQFAAAEEVEEEESDESAESENGILPKSIVKKLKGEKKVLGGNLRGLKKNIKIAKADLKRMESSGTSAGEIKAKQTEVAKDEAQAIELDRQIKKIDQQLEQHNILNNELKELKANIRQTEKKKDDLVEAAREKITSEEAQTLILERFDRLLHDEFDGYLRAYQRTLIAAVENLHNKYAVTAKEILAERDEQAQQLDQFLKELGYE